jgi:hypothetical protein
MFQLGVDALSLSIGEYGHVHKHKPLRGGDLKARDLAKRSRATLS